MDLAKRLTVVTPTLNCRAFIFGTLRSLQCAGNGASHIVIDGGSTDGTAEACASRPGTRVYGQTLGRTMYSAINQGMELAVTPWVTYLNGDDLALPGAYRRLVEVAEQMDADVVYGDICNFRRVGSRYDVRLTAAVPQVGVYMRKAWLPFSQPACIFRRELWQRLGGFDGDLRIVGDLEFFLRALEAGARFAYASHSVFTAFRLTGESLYDREEQRAEIERRAIMQKVNTRVNDVAYALLRVVRPIRSAFLRGKIDSKKIGRTIMELDRANDESGPVTE